MKNRKIIISVLAALLTLTAIIIPSFSASATAPIEYYEGSFPSGSLALDRNCPLTVDSQVLTFNISTFPDDGSERNASLSAEYRFFNPTDKDHSATLAFPFGLMMATSVQDERFTVSVDGTPVDARLRYTYSANVEDSFNTAENLAKLREGYTEDDFFTPDLTVLKITYHLKRVGNSDFVCLDLSSCTDPSFRILGSTATHFGYSDIQEITIYVMGSLPNEFPQWKFYTDSNMTTESQGEVNIISTEEMTFLELALSRREEGLPVSDTDWYNAVVDALNGEYGHPEYTGKYTYYEGLLNVKYALLGWLVYDMRVPAKAYVTNTVSTPIYPSYDYRLEPTVYNYKYLLSPAKEWKKFGSLTVIINTPFYMTDCSLEGFEKTDNGYRLELESLPEGELSFDICTSENPTESFDIMTVFLWILAAVWALLYTAAPVIGIVLLIALVGAILLAVIGTGVGLVILVAIVLTAVLIILKIRKKKKMTDN